MQTGYRYLEEMMARDEPNMPYFGVQVEQEHTAAVFEHALSFINAMWMYSDAMRPFYVRVSNRRCTFTDLCAFSKKTCPYTRAP
jgi:hypothetical protein